MQSEFKKITQKELFITNYAAGASRVTYFLYFRGVLPVYFLKTLLK